MKAAIVGCNGYLGRHLALYLKKENWEVHGYGRQAQTDADIDMYTQLDVQQKKDFEKLDYSVDFIFYFAGITGIATGYDNYEKFIATNETGLLHLLDKMKSAGLKTRIVYPSTRLIYKGVPDAELSENAEKEFKTIYALNKWFGEEVIRQYSRYFGLPYTIFRVCVPYGNLVSDKYSYGTIGFFLSKAAKKEPITLFGNGEPQRTFTHIEDICLQLTEALKHPASINNTYNTIGERYSLRSIAEQIGTRFGVELSLTEWPPLDALLESGDTVFDGQKLYSLIRKPLKHNFPGWLEKLK